MPKAYSGDLRVRVIEAVEAGASRHEAAECFEVSVASAVKWLQRWNKERSAAPKPRGGSVSPLERIKTSRSSLWRFFDRHNITLKKKPAGGGTPTSRRCASAPPLDTRARFS